MKKTEKECKNGRKKERVLLSEDKPDGLVFYPHEGGGTFLLIVSDPPKNNAALTK